jgi:transcription termination factor Rho
MTDLITESAVSAADAPRANGLARMLMPELKQLAHSLGISGVSGMRKTQLVAAITERQGGGGRSTETNGAPTQTNGAPAARRESPAPGDDRAAGADAPAAGSAGEPAAPHGASAESAQRAGTDQAEGPRGRSGQQPDQQPRGGAARGDQAAASSEGAEAGGGQQGGGQQPGGAGADDRGERRNRRNRRDRNRNRNERGADRERGGERADRAPREAQVSADDVLLPVAGILDILDNYAFVRTSGYLPGTNDVYVAMSMVKRHRLRKGDAVTGAIKQPDDSGGSNAGGRREKYNPLARLDTVNGTPVDQLGERPEFNKLTPLYPQRRLRLETTPQNLTTRIIDLVAPIGKGQRGLIVSPPKAGKTMVLQAIANAITTNNPECHLMVVLVDERPEEVTDMQRSVKGEVIASTFDRPAEDHTIVAELAIERAKRLVELGHDVVVLLDSMTRLGRAYNLSAPASGRILSGGVDSAALYPPKKFFGAARNIEDGGSLTILATALVETGSKMDEVIFEEFKGTGNMELKLDRRLADKRLFPAVDVDASGTRKEELLMSPEELKIVWKLRRVLHALDPYQAIELMLNKLRETHGNADFLMQVGKTTPGGSDD